MRVSARIRLFYLSFLPVFILVSTPVLVCAAEVSPAAAAQMRAEKALENAMIMRKTGRLLEAERQIRSALQLFPASAAYHFELANIFAARYDSYKRQKEDDAADRMLEQLAGELEQTVMIDPSFFPAQFNLGVAYKRLGHYEQARERFRRVIQLAEETGQDYVKLNTLIQIGATYEQQGFFDEARDTYDRAREIDIMDPAVKGALNDLDMLEENDRQRRALDIERQMNRFYSPFQYTPSSHAASQYNDRLMENQDGAGLAEAIPFLGMMLVQQFLSRSGEREDG